MSRSFKKFCFFTISKPWYRSNEKALRRKVKQACHEVEIDFDPDQDWIDLQATHKEGADWGTKYGYPVKPNPDDSVWGDDYNWYTKGLRK
ncbi:hypothetical protein LCGC14_0343370 [marine sediment metagenome]|uniref:Uncharacterized protein n=1 Tax=marine sediment metagenome TaxID=412755 RepID=A0A0F9TIQ7_9ZZZZ